MLARTFLRRINRVPTLVQRGFATESATELNPFEQLEKDGKAHEPPVQMFGTAAKFASAAYRQASQKKELDQVEKDLSTISGLLNGEEELRNFVNDPTAPEADKKEAIAMISKEYKFSEVTSGLLEVILEGGKVSQLDKINEIYGKYMSAKRGDVVAVVTSADKLSKKDEDAVRKALTARLEKGQNLVMSTQVDPKIVGGLVVEFGDELADLSVSSTLEDIGEALNSPGDE
eukprot:g2182.t1